MADGIANNQIELARSVAEDVARYPEDLRTSRMADLHARWTGLMAKAGMSAQFARSFADKTLAQATSLMPDADQADHRPGLAE